jgi:hypothetical protein
MCALVCVVLFVMKECDKCVVRVLQECYKCVVRVLMCTTVVAIGHQTLVEERVERKECYNSVARV